MLLQIPLLFFAESIPSSESVYYSILGGIVLVIAQLFLVTAYGYAEASQVGIYQYTTVIFVGLIDWMLWGTIPSPWDLLGILLVAIAGMIIIRFNHTKPVLREQDRA